MSPIPSRYNRPSLLDEWRHLLNYDPFEDDDGRGSGSITNWVPRVDIKNTDTAIKVVADIPGVDPKDIKVSLDKNILTIEGEKHTDAKKEEKDHVKIERVNGYFSRSFTLPDNVSAEGIVAKSKHGVLTLTIPKEEKGQSRRTIEIEE